MPCWRQTIRFSGSGLVMDFYRVESGRAEKTLLASNGLPPTICSCENPDDRSQWPALDWSRQLVESPVIAPDNSTTWPEPAACHSPISLT